MLSVICCVALLPVLTLPKLKVAGVADRWPLGVVVPLPARLMFTVGFVGSLLVMARFPVATPATVGLKESAIDTDCPALMTFGVEIPLMPNVLPVRATTETVRSELPVLDRVRFVLPWLPMLTVPKSTAEELTVS